MTEETIKNIYVSGHRNPDIDSLASAAALAELKRRQGYANVKAICPGRLSEKGLFLFGKFGVTPPEPRSDVYFRIHDIMETDIPVITEGTTLFQAVDFLNKSGYVRLPVVDKNGKFLGMLSPINLLSNLLGIGADYGNSLTGRKIHSSIKLIADVIQAEILTGSDLEVIEDLKAYVAAMNVESFDSHLPQGEERRLIVISGDRSEIHLRAIQRKIRLMIITGEKAIEPLILQVAHEQNVAILKTQLDSAAVIRRLKFTVPVESYGLSLPPTILHPEDRVSKMSSRILGTLEDVIPVVDSEQTFLGAVFKKSVNATPPYRMILVDHNEPEQSVLGVEEIPLMEVVDHHRIGIRPTNLPIKFTGDIVGSTCTLVTGMYFAAGESISKGMAGILLGGIISDTLNCKSPTTTDLDRRMIAKLEQISGISANELMGELSHIDSPLVSQSPDEVIKSDRKFYENGPLRFTLSQVEETNLELFHQRQPELTEAMQKLLVEDKLDFIGLMVTDAVREISELLVVGNKELLRQIPYERHENGLFYLPGVLSRKKQLLPQMLTITLPN